MHPQIFQSVCLVLLACAFFAGANTFAKAVGESGAMGPDIHPLQIAFSRFLFGLLTIAPALLLSKQASWRPRAPLKYHFGRVALGLGGLICGFWALTVMPLADVVSIAFSSPIFTMLFAVLFLGEFVGLRRSAAAAVGFLGVLVMVQPTSETFQVFALVALLGAVFTGGEVVMVRVLALREHPVTVLFINNAVGTILAFAIAFPVLQWPSVAQWPLLAGVGVTMVIGQLFFVRAMALGEANFLAPFYYSSIVYAAILGFVIFGETPGWHSYAGAALIVASGLYISLRGERKRQI